MKFEDVYENLRTTEEQGKLLLGIESLLEMMYRPSKEEFHDLILREIPSVVARPLEEALRSESQTHDTIKIKGYLEGLRDTVHNLHVLSLEIACIPTEETIAVLIGWVRKNIGNNVLLEITTDRTLLAGVRVVFGGFYKEINLASMIQIFMQQREQTIHSLLYE